MGSVITASSDTRTNVSDTKGEGHSGDADAAKAPPTAEAFAEGVENPPKTHQHMKPHHACAGTSPLWLHTALRVKLQ